MITFIVTTYNLEDWLLRRCLDSIVAQGFPRDQYEIIVVDDESTVLPQHVVNDYKQQAHITLYVQQHARQGAARNLGIRHAQGEWIQFVDGDDYLFPGTMVPAVGMAQESNLDLLMFGYREVHDTTLKESPYTSKATVLPITTGEEYMLHHNLSGSCWMQFFRKTLLNHPQYGEPLRFTEGVYIEDEDFTTKLVWRSQRMTRMSTPIYAYYQRVGSTVHSRSLEHTDELFHNSFGALSRLAHFEASLDTKPHAGVTRKVRFLALDILRRALREHNGEERWHEAAQQLRTMGLYPIPAARYSWKYTLFRLLASCSIGRYILKVVETNR